MLQWHRIRYYPWLCPENLARFSTQKWWPRMSLFLIWLRSTARFWQTLDSTLWPSQ